jgi:hypothetical protein
LKHTIQVDDYVYNYLKNMIEDEHIQNADMSEERNADGYIVAHRPTFSEVIEHLIEDREVMERLEDDYLSWVREYYRDLGDDVAEQKAQTTLAKIREGH